MGTMCKRSNYTQNAPRYEGDCEYRISSITNDIDSILIHSNVISDSIVDGGLSNVLCMYQTDTLIRGHPFSIEPKRPLFCPVSWIGLVI